MSLGGGPFWWANVTGWRALQSWLCALTRQYPDHLSLASHA